MSCWNNSVHFPAIADFATIEFRAEQHTALGRCIKGAMHRKARYIAQIDNIYFVRRIGASLREATADTVREDLPENIRLLLRRLERLEAKGSTKKAD